MKTTPVPAADYALKAGLPLFTPNNLKSAEIEAQLASHHADLCSCSIWIAVTGCHSNSTAA